MNTSQLAAIRQQLAEQKKLAIKQMGDLKKSDPFSDPDYSSDNAAVDTDVREQEGHDVIMAEISSLQQRVQDIDAAIVRIEKGQYGYCSKCGKNIPDARLQLIPEAQYCVDCESTMKK